MSPFLLFLLTFTWAMLMSQSVSQTCSSQTFTSNTVYAHCLDLPSLTSYLHFAYNSTNSTLSVAFTASPPSSGGWISWALNPVAPQMVGSQALVAYKNSSSSAVTVKFYNVSGYRSVVPSSKLSFDVWDARAVEVASGGMLRIFATVKVPEDMAVKGTVNQVWQVGPSVGNDGALGAHAFSAANLASKATLDLNGGGSTTAGGGSDSRLKKKHIHGILNAVSWGVLFPLGVMIARYVRSFPSADPAWFYLHVSSQVSGYAIGVAGWATGLQLGSQSKGITYTYHRNIGIALFSIATLQIFALFLRPKKDHKYRLYWNIYHHGVGYAIVVLGILNVFKGFDILQPEHKWRTIYIIVIASLGGIAALLEIVTWIIVLKRKNSEKSTKPYDSYNNGQGRQQPLTAA